jgi:hypothetical protein
MTRFALAAITSLALVSAADAQTVNDQSAAARGKHHKVKTDPGHLGAAWWQLGLSLPTSINPFIHQRACGFGQTGTTWFLYSTAQPAGALGHPATPQCTIPAGQQIFLAVFTNVCIPDFGTTIEENCATDNLDTPTLLRLEIDGVDYSNLIERRTSARPFTLHVPTVSPIGYPPGFFEAVHDGYYALLPALTSGDHVIVYQGVFDFDGQTVAFDTIHTVHIVESAKVLPPA